MYSKKSILSIGLPVFNGERYISQAIDSILIQTFKDFELIISDNASTDRTEQICQEYVKKDSRIKYHKNERNIGGPNNYNLLVKLASGKYFKWAAHDDVLEPTYLEKCINILENDSSIVLCHSKVGCIDENGVLIGNYDYRTLNRISSWKPHERFADMISLRNTCWAIHAVIRTEILKKTRLHGDYIDADRNFLAEVALLGRIYEIPEHLIFRRDHPLAYTSIYYSKGKFRDYRAQLIWWTGKKTKRLIVLPHWKNFFEYINSINRSPMKLSERISCYQEVGRWLLKEKGLQRMRFDLENELKFWLKKLT